ncbi:DUF547 domain-containing protein [Kordiimonas gwangyangensis]|nr:DUF547 domain-containing protein [Kordiimonas gwangyangensis]
MCAAPFAAQASEVPFDQFLHQAAAQEAVSINYDDWSYVLRTTVFEGGRSDRTHAAPPAPGIGRRIVKGNTSSTRFEGNRLYFPAFKGQNLVTLKHIRAELEAMPGAVPLVEWTKNQQLAYWLNLYNIKLVELLAEHYPEQELRSLLYGGGSRSGLLDQPALKVAGVRLSLNNIHHDIILANWQDPLVMYELFHGFVGSANIRSEAYRADTVWDQLRENAVEFINSNRGARMDGDILRVAEIYRENLELFPGGPDELKAHIVSLADADYAPRFAAARTVVASTRDYYIADLFQGYERDLNPNAGNSAAIVEALTGSSNADVAEWMSATMDRQYFSAAPGHVMEYLGKVRERNEAREGNVNVEEYEGSEKTEAPVPE